MSDFGHVADKILRHVLQGDPRHLKTVWVAQAVEATLDALGRDVIDQTIPAHALESRIKAAADARKAIDRRQRTKAHQALVRFWS